MDVTKKISKTISYLDDTFIPTNKKNAIYEVVTTYNDDMSVKKHSVNVKYKSKEDKTYKEEINGKKEK